MRAPTLLFVVLAAGFAARVGYGLARPPQAPAGALADPDGYVALATSVSRDWTLTRDGKLSASREPVYPVLLGTAFKLFGRRYATILVLNALANVAAIGLLFFTARRFVGERAALGAAAVAAFYPAFLYYCGQCMREAVMSLASVAVVAMALKAEQRKTLGWAAAAGAAAGFGGLVNTTFAPFAAFGAALHAVLGRSRAALLRAVVWGFAAFVVYLPWPLRNIAVFHQPIIGSTAGAGSTFYTYLVVPQEIGGTPKQAEIMGADPIYLKGQELESVAQERYFWREGVKRVRAAPGAFLRLVAWRFFIDEWRILPRDRDYGGPSYRLLRRVSLLSDGWIVPLGLIGLALALARLREALYPAAFVVAFILPYAMVFSMIRYRFALMPWLILFAAFTLDRAAAALGWKGGPA
ncbi:MAG: glycosyltransferase family 39 protein [Elusimicrobia bacterium]|nr:glycosyltransferase family 39 protein [Elusimicrobiota bacterium]